MPTLERVTDTTGVCYYRSPTLFARGVPHGFSTRIGGVSGGAFGTMNLGNPNGAPIQDDPNNIAENYARLHQSLGVADRQRCYVHQVHGAVVELAETGKTFDCNRKADAVASDDPGRVAAVRTADCVPVLLASHDGRAVAAVHAGWRGVVAGAVVAGVRAVRALLNDAHAPLCAAIGPAISFDAFEVGPEVAAEFTRVFGHDAAPLLRGGRADRVHIDLQRAIVIQLRTAGFAADQIDINDRCTIRDADEFFSHRRENGLTGRMAAMIGSKRRS